MSNEAMPGLVKIGYSTKDPDLRAKELSHTGAPHPYVVDYTMLIENPREVESKAHKILSQHREGKEWFRCSPEEAISAIQQIAGDNSIHEEFKRADRIKAEEITRKQEAQTKAKVALKPFIDTAPTTNNSKKSLISRIDDSLKNFFKDLAPMLACCIAMLLSAFLTGHFLISTIIGTIAGLAVYRSLNLEKEPPL